MVFLRFGEIPVLTSFAHPASGWQVEKCTKFRWFFGVWENLVFCFQDLLTFRKSDDPACKFLKNYLTYTFGKFENP